uniref:Uncharacterized protein n=1 Tax=Arundo donax TaxID=35708 RepID=A0A0A9CAM8_ARUDO
MQNVLASLPLQTDLVGRKGGMNLGGHFKYTIDLSSG